MNEVHELLLLGLLADGEAHGYELHEFLAEKLAYVTDLTRPTAYRMLDRMHKEGLLDRELERAGKRPERMRYRITDAGRKKLDQLLEARLSAVDRFKPEGNVALLFMQRLPRADAARLLAVRKRELEARSERLLAHYRELPEASAQRLVLDRNLSLMEADIAWLGRTIARLEREAAQGDERAVPSASQGTKKRGSTRPAKN